VAGVKIAGVRVVRVEGRVRNDRSERARNDG
jgi:hypothetical protein